MLFAAYREKGATSLEMLLESKVPSELVGLASALAEAVFLEVSCFVLCPMLLSL